MWILQKNIWKEKKYDEMVFYLNRMGVDYRVVDIIPFTDNVNWNGIVPDPSEITFIMGSIKMEKIMASMGVRTFNNANFDYNVWGKILNHHCLNSNVKFMYLSEIIDMPIAHDCFIRPVMDDKSFTGCVLREGDIFRDCVQRTTDKDVEVIIAPVQNIMAEYRGYVVDGGLVTASLYKRGNSVNYQMVNAGDPVLGYMEEIINNWMPDESFVIDVAINSDNEYKVIEFGCIHNCGLYDADISKLIQAIEKKYNKQCK